MGRRSVRLLCLLLIGALSTSGIYVVVGNARASGWVKVADRGISGGYNPAQYAAVCSAALGSTLFVGTESYAVSPGGQLWGWNGSAWFRASEDGFGDPNNVAVTAVCALGSTLYAGTENALGCQVWRRDGTGAGDWSRVNEPGFGDPARTRVDSFIVFHDGTGERLFAGAGDSIWRLDGPEPGDWSRVNLAGFDGSDVRRIYSMAVYDSRLHASTLTIGGCQVWRWDGPEADDWVQVNEDGFGDTAYLGATSMLVADVGFGEELFVGTGDSFPNGCRVWRYVGPDPDDWMQMNTDGFGAPEAYNKRAVRSMAVYGSELYVGVDDYTDGCGVWRFDGPDPDDWTQVNDDGFGDDSKQFLYDLAAFTDVAGASLVACTGSSAQVWRWDGSGPGGWSMVSTDGLTGDNNAWSSAMTVFDDGIESRLCAGTANYFGGGEVWAYDDSGWTRISLPGFGEPLNKEVRSLAVYDDGGGGGPKLYAGTYNYEQGCEVWRRDGPSPGDWTQVNVDGFGDRFNRAAQSMAVHDDGGGARLYVGTSSVTDYNDTLGCEVWAYDGSGWSQVNDDGFGDPDNQAAASMAVFDDGFGSKLFVGTNSIGKGCQVWRRDGTDPSDWTLVNPCGFGDSDNRTATSMVPYNDRGGEKLYVATHNDSDGCQVWRASGSSWEWEPISLPGFGDADNYGINAMATFDDGEGLRLYAGTRKAGKGCEVWRYDSPGSDDWTQVNDDGFGSGDNTAASSMAAFSGGLLVSTENNEKGCEVWKLGSSFSISAMVDGGGGSVDPTDQQVEYGESAFIDLIPDPGYHVASITDNAVTMPLADPYVIGDVKEDHHVVVTFSIDSYTVEASVSGTGGKVSPTIQQVDWGGTVSIDLIPDPGYHVASITDNAVTMPLADPYVIGDVKEDHHVVVTFSPDSGPTIYDFYFAEGYTGEGFREYLCLGNPHGDSLEVKVTCLFADGSPSMERTYDVPGLSRQTLDVNAVVGEGKEVSIVCEAEAPFIAERPMYFNYRDRWAGGHDVVGADSPSRDWYFAEGYTGPGFEEWICVLNPGDGDAELTFRFQTQEEGERVITGCSVPAHSRRTFKANDLLSGGFFQVSLALESSAPVVAERPMYFDYAGRGNRHWAGGHCVMGATGLSTRYYFAEGTTRAGFEEWLTLQNPGDAPITVHAVYMLGTGDTVERDYEVGAGRRNTVFVSDEVGVDQDVSVYLSCPVPFLAERPTYFAYPGTGNWGWDGGHCVMGIPGSATSWFFAEGYTGPGFEEWICIQNPGSQDAAVEITYYPQGAAPINPGAFTVPANSRHTVFVNAHAGPDLSLCAEVSSDKPIICERPMYFDYNGAWTGGHDVAGYAP